MGKTNDFSGDFPDNFAAGASFRNLSKICTIFCGNGVCPDNCESTVFSLGTEKLGADAGEGTVATGCATERTTGFFLYGTAAASLL